MLQTSWLRMKVSVEKLLTKFFSIKFKNGKFSYFQCKTYKTKKNPSISSPLYFLRDKIKGLNISAIKQQFDQANRNDANGNQDRSLGRNHAGKRPYKCRSFATKINRLKHYKTHSLRKYRQRKHRM